MRVSDAFTQRTFLRDLGRVKQQLNNALARASSGHRVRYASDDQAPTLYHRWSGGRGGRAVVSEPLESGECWEAVPQGTFCTFDGERVQTEPFAPEPIQLGLAAE